MNKATETSGLKTRLALLSGTALAASWYFSAKILFSGAYAETLAVMPAIAMAGILPTAFLSRQSKRAVRESQQPLSQRLEVLSRHVIVNVVDTKHCLAEVNAEFEKATGYSQEEILGKPVSMLYYDLTARHQADKIRKGLMAGQTWQGETALRRKDGSLLQTHTTVIPLFAPDGTWEGSISARTDITRVNQLMAEQETVESLDELRDDIWIIDAESNRFSYANRVASARLGWGEEGYREKSMNNVPDRQAAETIKDACSRMAKTGEELTRFEMEMMDVPFDVTIKFLRVANKKNRFLVMLDDISVRLVEERKKSEFISMVSHELRSPLTSIKGSMGLLLSKAAGELPDKARALLEIAHRNADRLVLIINDILDLEKIAAGQFEFETKDVDLADLVEETNQANAMMRHRFALDVQISGVDRPLPIHTDPNRIIQVLTNLLSNACKFSKPNGRVELSVEDLGGAVRVSVKDEGQGIPEKDQHKIFERFADLGNSDRQSKGGTGLGLSICKAIIEGLGGTIGFESEEGVGTTFYFVLPKGKPLGQSIQDDAKRVMREAS